MKKWLEDEIFQFPIEKVWKEIHNYFMQRNPVEIENAVKKPKYRMSLLFRWYLGKTAQWAIEGDTSRCLDYQICCGPSMGAFNAWVAGSYLQYPENRTVVDIALNLLEGAAIITRAQQLRSCGLAVPETAFSYKPRQRSIETDSGH